MSIGATSAGRFHLRSLTLLRRRPLLGYAFAVAAIALAILLRLAAMNIMPPELPSITFFPAVIATTLLAGLGPGVVAGVLAVACLFVPPYFSFDFARVDVSDLLFFAMILAIDIAIIHVMTQALFELRRSRQEADDALQRLVAIGANVPGVVYQRRRSPEGEYSYPLWTGKNDIFNVPPDVDEHGRYCAIVSALDDDDRKRWLLALQHSARTMTPFAFEGRVGDKWFRSESNIRLTPDGGVVWDGVALDITHLHEAAAAVKESRDELHFALKNARAGAWAWDVAADRGRWSDETYDLFGVARGTALTFDLWCSLIHPEDRERIAAASRAAIDGACAELSFEFRILHPDKGLRWMQSIGRAIAFDPAGKPTRLSGLNMDITERKLAEAALEGAKEAADRANLGKSKFLAAASHDLRQPVQSMILFAHALAAKLRGHPAGPIVDKLMGAQESLKALLDSLLDLSKLEAGLVTPENRPVDVSTLIEEMASAYQLRAADKGLSFSVRSNPAWADTDPTLLTRVLSNLLDNALKYTAKGGFRLSCRRVAGQVRLDVTDSGVGIAAEHLGDIFHEFVQVGEHGREQKQGMGLGLATVKRLVDLLGARLVVSSRPGRGSRFSVLLPACAAPADRRERLAEVENMPPGGKRILVVDDETVILDGMKVLLEGWGYEPVVATSLDGALASLATAGPPAALVADFRLGAGVTGPDVIGAVRHRVGREVPAVLLSGDTGLRAGREFMVLHKPVSPDYLRHTLAKLCA